MVRRSPLSTSLVFSLYSAQILARKNQQRQKAAIQFGQQTLDHRLTAYPKWKAPRGDGQEKCESGPEPALKMFRSELCMGLHERSNVDLLGLLTGIVRWPQIRTKPNRYGSCHIFDS